MLGLANLQYRYSEILEYHNVDNPDDAARQQLGEGVTAANGGV